MRSLRIALGVLALSGMACAPRQATLTASNDIQGETPVDAKFAIFGAADDVPSRLMIIASEDPALCDLAGPGFAADVVAGQIQGNLLAVVIDTDDPLASGQEIQGSANGPRVETLFLVSNSTELFVNAKDTTATGVVTIDELIDGESLSATVSANLNQDLS